MIKISRIEICVGGAKRWPVGGTVVKSNYTNGYSGLGWSTANIQQSLMKNGFFHLPLSVHLVAELSVGATVTGPVRCIRSM